MDVQNEVVINVKKVTKKYGNNIILKDVSFSIAHGKIVGIIGPNGAGKSTLANIILGFDSDYTGSVNVKDGVRIAYIPQFSNSDKYVLPMSVYEFIRSSANNYYKIKHSNYKQVIYENLRHVGLTDKHISQNVYSLSGGEKQRVLIARALIGNPNFIVLDEPLASVDYATRNTLYTLLKHLNEKHSITMMLISHDIKSILNVCDSVFCLNKKIHNGCHPLQFMLEDKADNTMYHNHNI